MDGEKGKILVEKLHFFCNFKVYTYIFLIYKIRYGPAGVIKAAIEFLIPSLMGKDPLENETLWNEMYQRSLDFGRRGIFLAGLSAIDIALWDLKGKYFR